MDVQTQTQGRLSSAMFLTVLAHGVIILGVTFSVGPIPELVSSNLKVSLAVGPLTETPPETEFIAAENQLGTGLQEDVFRPTTTLSSADLINLEGTQGAQDLADAMPEQTVPSTTQLVTTAETRQQAAAPEAESNEVAPEPQQAAELLALNNDTTAAAELDLESQTQKADVDTDVEGASARQSMLANYLSLWRTKVERVGTLNFPREFIGRSGTGNLRPRLEIAIRSDGSLNEVIVQRSSGDVALDRAAINILAMAAPFEPLPPRIQREMSELRFAYEFDFRQ